jgi:hypothetical protein
MQLLPPPDDIIEAVKDVAQQLHNLAEAVIPSGACGCLDVTGTRVDSLTEAVMGVSAAGVQIAEAIRELAAAIREQRVIK